MFKLMLMRFIFILCLHIEIHRLVYIVYLLLFTRVHTIIKDKLLTHN